MDTKLEALVEAFPRLLEGLWVTLQLTAGGSLLALIVALTLGMLARSPNILVRGTARTIIEFFRGTSLVVQLFWLFFVLPQLGVEFPAMFVGILALGLNYGAYSAEVVRGSINAVSTGQWEATWALSMGPVHRMRRVIFPQAWALMIPSLTNYLVHLLKGTAIVSFITMHDLAFHIDQLRRGTGTFFAYGVVGLLGYFLVAYLLTLGMNALEIRAKHRLGQGQSLREILSLRPPRTTVGGEDGA